MPDFPMKQCTRCKKLYPCTSEFFYFEKRSADGLRTKCKSCMNEYNREYQGTHKAKAPSPEKYSLFRERQNELARARRKTPEGQEKERIRKERRKRRIARTDQALTPEQWHEALHYFGYGCAVCGAKSSLWIRLEQDHWVSEDRGGNYTQDNIIPLCAIRSNAPFGTRSCNQSKRNKNGKEWLIDQFGQENGMEIYSRIAIYLQSVRDKKPILDILKD